MATITQAERLLVLDTQAGSDVLLISSFAGNEALSTLFRYEIEMVAERSVAAQIVPEKMIGTKCSVHLALTTEYSGSPRRHFNGIINRFSQGHADRRFVHYRAEVVPWLWLLSLKTDCRIFQGKTIPEIVETILQEARSASDAVHFRSVLNRSYTKLDYCVQYRESSFNFISRLFEQEGIFYFWEHDSDKHTLVYADATSAYKPCPHQPVGQYIHNGGWGEADNAVTTWETKAEIRSGKYTFRDYHMQMPSRTLEQSVATRIAAGNNSSLEIYDYPGGYAQRFSDAPRQSGVESEGTKLVAVRMEEVEAPQTESFGSSLCRGLVPGFTLKLTEHYDRAANRKYVITSVRHTAVQTPWYAAEEGSESDEPYQNSFVAIPDDVIFRPPRTTPRPTVQGSQTALVVGKAGEEIWTDEFSRIKVQFHWDRVGTKNEKSSCWVRVATHWAGKQWGAIHIPRIGQEVVVDFLEGDPDQPIVIGSVYNADMMPPYPLPDSGTQSGIKTRSSKGGGPSNFNEIRFEDKKGGEELYIHAEKNKNVVVENDRSENVGHDESITIGHDRTESVGHDETISIANDRTESVGKNESITIGANRTRSVDKNEEITIGQDRTCSIGRDQQTTVGRDQFIDVGRKHIMNVADEIQFVTGDASIVMKKNGDISIKGKNISIIGSGKIDVKADSKVTIKGSQILEN